MPLKEQITRSHKRDDSFSAKLARCEENVWICFSNYHGINNTAEPTTELEREAALRAALRAAITWRTLA